MSKEVKLYVPIGFRKVEQSATGFGKRLSPTVKKIKETTTLVTIKDCPTIQKQLPEWRDVIQHLDAQRVMTKQGSPFTSVKVLVAPSLFETMQCELIHKIGRSYSFPVIDLIMGSGQLPIIQIIPDLYTRRKRTKFYGEDKKQTEAVKTLAKSNA